MNTFAIGTPDGVRYVEADAWQVDDSGHLGLFQGGAMTAVFWAGEWDGHDPVEALPPPVNDNAPPVAEGTEPAPVDPPPAA